jgi:hypothetical protein
MEIVVDIKKGHAYLIMSLLLVLIGIFSVNAFADASGVGHDPKQIGPGIFGGTLDDTHTFTSSVIVKEKLVADGDFTVDGTSAFTKIVLLPTIDGEPFSCDLSQYDDCCSKNEVGTIYIDTKGTNELKLCVKVSTESDKDEGRWSVIN